MTKVSNAHVVVTGGSSGTAADIVRSIERRFIDRRVRATLR